MLAQGPAEQNGQASAHVRLETRRCFRRVTSVTPHMQRRFTVSRNPLRRQAGALGSRASLEHRPRHDWNARLHGPL